MIRVRGIVVATLSAGVLWLALESSASAETRTTLHAVIIRAAGPLTGEKKAKTVDAVTEATPRLKNTYVFSEELSRGLELLNVETRIVDFSKCQHLECLLIPSETGDSQKTDIVIFAGPAFFSKLPKQLQTLLPELSNLAKTTPGLVCSSLVAAWYPKTKGVEAAKQVDHAAADAGLRTVMGVSLLTPRNKKTGVSEKEMNKALDCFAARLANEARTPMTSENRKPSQP